MKKLAQDLKKRFLHMIDSIKFGCNTYRGSEDGEEPKLRSVQKASIKGRGIPIKTPRGPKRPGVPKGAPPQTS
ncbi:hypothetical protein L484_020065 [Morus notabilis]|uniref:Uncharacterized protein n=1 Tax=Morus notabilis TaxID=981085 RepID=W9RB41_9ROSA|nr:hypothetical protein L484_020065 [Morus notabilis]